MSIAAPGSTTASSTSQDGVDQSWKLALGFAKKVGYIPGAFSQGIRLLIADHFNNDGQLRAVTKYQVSRIFRGPSFKVTLYFASCELREEYLKKNKACSVGDLVALYSPLELAAFITCFFLNRRMKKVNPKHWETISTHFNTEAAIGALIGLAIPRIGCAPGLLLTALRNVSLALMSLDNPKSYTQYRMKLKASGGRISNPEIEKEIWGTTTAQVSSMVLATLGFKAEIGDTLSSAVSTSQAAIDIKSAHVQKFRLAYLWTDALMRGLAQPEEKLDGTLFPLTKDRQYAEGFIKKVLSGERTWLERTKAELTKEFTPHFFENASADPNLEIPDEIKDVFNIAEITAMEEEDFDKLLDQIDSEQASSKKRDDVISSKDLQELEEQCD